MKINSLQKSKNDKRDYLFRELPNGLKFLIISDPETDKSAAALTVNVGSLSDPVEFEGMAHFLEHMLFMGTEKYPNENEFGEFISENSGSSNAFTDLDQTNYHFDVSNAAFDKALDIFANFFISPLFKEGSVEREMKAVDSEFKKNLRDDSWRFGQLLYSQFSKKNPYSKFSIGNFKTLNKPGIRENMIKFYNQYYSARIMNLVILNSKPLNELEELVEKLFSKINSFPVNFDESIFENPFVDENLVGNFFKVVPVRDEDTLKLYWSVDYSGDYYRTLPLYFIIAVLGHEGPNSLYSSLFNDGLVTALESDYTNITKAFSFVSIDINLTDKGYKNWKEIVKRILYFVKKLQNSKINSEFFNELKIISRMGFDYAEKESPYDYCTDLASSINKYQPCDILTGGYLMEEENEEIIKKYLDDLQIHNLNVYLVSQKCENKCNKKEKWFKTKYSKTRFPDFIHEFFENLNVESKICDYEINYPPRNTFIPTKFDIIAPGEQDTKFPKMIQKDNHSIVFYKKDNLFSLPKAIIHLQIYLNRNFLIHYDYEITAYLWNSIVKNNLREMTYMAAETSIKSKLLFNRDGLYIKVKGFDTSLKTYIEELISKFIKINPLMHEKIFQTQIEKYKKDVKNFYYIPPIDQALRHLCSLIYELYLDPIDEIEKIDTFKFSIYDIENFTKMYLKESKFEWLIQGNISENESLEIVKSTENLIRQSDLKEDNRPLVRICSIPKRTHFFYKQHIQDEENKNSAIVSYFQLGNLDTESICILKVLENYLSDKFFDQLRTKQQLGYITSLYYSSHRKIDCIICQIQSPTKHPQYLSERITEFFNSIRQEIENISDEEFQKFVLSVSTVIKAKDLKLGSEVSRNYLEIKYRDYEFDVCDRMIKILEKITKQELIQFFLENFIFNYRRMDIDMISKEHEDEYNISLEEEKEKSRVHINSPKDFKRRVFVFPDYLMYDDKKLII